ncbi:hypothetical protein P154DRAFT_620463 [Amniculicola lignicola CBS 123094]|uniref:Non-structural maintenance of chromosomes element 1 homolog n=1 Tax=Amniculicola lignicola CBS 123094 TaxID=1392246 RepID=A0A6A5WDT8_9PLEO|nr:hypothetical protein P154DRAFT_620463 [Amniculicola lignicola CBS 123094]
MSRDDSEIRGATPDHAGRYSNSHRAFLQAFLSRPVMSFEEMKPIYAAIMSAENPNRPYLEGDVTQADIVTHLQLINTRLSPLDYEIKSMKEQEKRTTLFALVNTTSDLSTQFATTFSPDEIAYIKRLLDAMFETNNTRTREVMAVGGMQPIQLAKAPRSRESRGGDDTVVEGTQGESVVPGAKTITHADAERVLETLVAQSFFAKSRAGYYTLAPRALLELRGYLKETYNEPAGEDPEVEPALLRIRDCEACKEIVTVGQRCVDRSCGARLHDVCAGRLMGRGAKKCPTCKMEWSGEVFVGERADTTARRGRQSNGGRRRLEVDEEEEEEEE